MKIKDRQFPYPVLSPFNDDIKSEPLKVEIKADSVEENMEFTVEFELKNETLLNLIDEGKAVYGVHLECTSTMKRFFEKSDAASFSFKINQRFLNNIVEINFFVVAKEEISTYQNSDAHEDFEDMVFTVEKGERLAFAETIKMNITKEQIAKPNSIFELAVNAYDNAPLFAADFQEKIVVSVPKSAYEEITTLRGFIGADVDQLLIMMYYMPALIEALYYVKDLIDTEELHLVESTVWYRSIAKRLETLGENIEELGQVDNIPNLAIQILDNVNERALTSIARIFGIEEGSEV